MPDSQETFRFVFDSESCLPIEAIQRYLNYCCKRGLAVNTINTYAYRLADFWRWLQHRALSWDEVGLTELADFVNWYLLGGEVEVISEELREKVSKRSARTVNQAITAIQGMYEFHVAEGRISERKFSKLTHSRSHRGGFLRGIVKSTPENRKRIKLREPKIFPGCLSDKEITRLVEACFTYRDRLIIMLFRETGIRRGELLGLHLEDVGDLPVSGRIRIVRRSNPNQAWAKGAEREIPILHDREIIQETFLEYLQHEYPPKAEKLSHGLFFVNLAGKNVGQPMSASRVNKLFDQIFSRTGIKAHPHLFRHTYATRMLQLGYDEHYIQQCLGHKSIVTTKDTYSHVLDELKLSEILK